jgi:hypothetical protein
MGRAGDLEKVNCASKGRWIREDQGEEDSLVK